MASSSPSVWVLFDGDGPKKPRACVPCNARKVRCDAGAVGAPCSQCTRRKRTSDCILMPPPSKKAKSQVSYAQKPIESAPFLRPTERQDPTVPSNVESTSRRKSDRLQRHSDEESQNNWTPSTSFSPSSRQRVDGANRSHLSVQESPVVPDEDTCLQVFREMSRWETTAESESPSAPRLQAGNREVVEYQGATNSITILGEVLAPRHPRRLVRIHLRDSGQKANQYDALDGLEVADREFLRVKGALSLPDTEICDQLLKTYFECVYPFAPVVDRSQLMREYTTGVPSLFIMYSIFANVAPYTPLSFIHHMGFSDRLSAQKSFFSKAKLLYDFGCEKVQLRLLQGTLILSSFILTYAMDNDYRFWLSNAARLATQMGLHRNGMVKELEPSSRKLFRRIWWVLYNRDVILAVTGLNNVRKLHDDDCDVSPLTVDDLGEDTWDNEGDMGGSEALPPISELQKQYIIENCKLSILGSQFVNAFRKPGKAPSASFIAEFAGSLVEWRRALPTELRIESVQEWSSSNVWIIILLATSYHLEAIFCRAQHELHRHKDQAMMERAIKRQQSAMYELGTIIQRASLHDVIRFCPLSFMTCASTNLAMYIESALDAATTEDKKLSIKTQIHAGLASLKEGSEHWSSIKWTLRMFEAIVARTGLSLTQQGPEQTSQSQLNITSMIPLAPANYEWFNSSSPAGGDLPDVLLDFDAAGNLGTVYGSDTQDWMQDFLGTGSYDFSA
ncbi:hypothetical protein PV10_06713 [Exophiala mesophila]|uniref:Zn(2)-C6 fungal-type domain-containing protein n=1 Tax=Exophiala mesophila TaxID=212818 RepID=A0A0D1XVE7_EXOME|nr:uncharacterized protein PV10_06713 [Exophiala mesophila]KIV92256.1 hypothetical protein PV10_06713 [Exophiala mesophila]